MRHGPLRSVWVHVNGDGRAIHILKRRDPEAIEMSRKQAVEDIRTIVMKRDENMCNHCGNPVTWHSGHMHERRWRGRGGEVSVDNCVMLCPPCHQDDPVAGHGTRKPQFGRAIL